MGIRIQRLRACWFFYAVVLLLVSVRFASASYHHEHSAPTGYYSSNPPPQYNSGYTGYAPNTYVADPRGGSTLHQHQPVDHWVEQIPQEEPFQPPKISLNHMAMALRLTGEWNRRLLEGVSRRLQFWKQHDEPTPTSRSLQPRGGSHPVHVHPSRSWHPPIQVGQEEPERLTLFHAKAPRPEKKSSKTPVRGAARWGPELLPYLEHIVDLLGLEDSSDGVEIALAMIYLDRACSVETPRSTSVPPCPYCTPRSVHRLSLVALCLAAQAVHGGDTEDYFQRLQSLGIPLPQLQQMVDWMKGALGDSGLLVTVGQMKDWSQTWDSIFHPKRKVQQKWGLPAVEQQRLPPPLPPQQQQPMVEDTRSIHPPAPYYQQNQEQPYSQVPTGSHY
jgi:hypothetical protein